MINRDHTLPSRHIKVLSRHQQLRCTPISGQCTAVIGQERRADNLSEIDSRTVLYISNRKRLCVRRVYTDLVAFSTASV